MRMINDKKLTQEGGENSSNIQGNNVSIYNSGLTYSDARDIALDVFKANFIEMSNKASLLAKDRAEELVNNFLEKLQQQSSPKLENIQDPDIQYALFQAQKQYARSGNKELEEILTNLLLERFNENSQSLKTIVLNEAIEIAAKLTSQQLDTLTIIFIIRDTQNNNATNKVSLINYLNTYFKPFISNLSYEKSCYKHLEYTATCGSVGLGEDDLAQYFIDRYRGLFSKGFSEEKFNRIVNDNDMNALIIPALNNNSLRQFRCMSTEILERKVIDELGKSRELYDQLSNLFLSSTMNVDETDKYLIELLPEMELLIDVWRNTDMCVMNPTSVGVVLACMNIKRKAGIDMDIDIWIK